MVYCHGHSFLWHAGSGKEISPKPQNLLERGQGALEERHHDVALWRQSSCSASQRFSWEDLEQPPANSDVRIRQARKSMVKNLRQADFLMVLLRSYSAEESVAYP